MGVPVLFLRCLCAFSGRYRTLLGVEIEVAAVQGRFAIESPGTDFGLAPEKVTWVRHVSKRLADECQRAPIEQS